MQFVHNNSQLSQKTMVFSTLLTDINGPLSLRDLNGPLCCPVFVSCRNLYPDHGWTLANAASESKAPGPCPQCPDQCLGQCHRRSESKSPTGPGPPSSSSPPTPSGTPGAVFHQAAKCTDFTGLLFGLSPGPSRH